MSGTRTINEHVTHAPRPAIVDLKLEVVAIPVSDVDRAKAFYENLGWTLDADFMVGKNFRAARLTPPGSPGPTHLGATGVAGSAKGMFLVVSDIDAARKDLVAHGTEVSGI